MSIQGLKRVIAGAASGLIFFLTFGQTAIAADTWNPTLLVNTEAFQTVQEGDGSSQIEMRFGQILQEKLIYERANSRFRLTRGLFVSGNLTATGALSVRGVMSGATLRVDGYADIWGSLSATGSILAKQNVTAKQTLSGTTLRVSGNASVHGTFTATGNILTDGDLTINDDRTTGADATLTFGNQTTNQTLKFIHANQWFEFSTGLNVKGQISGASLRVSSGGLNIRNVQYYFPSAQGASSTFLRNDGAGNLSWTTPSVGNGSGGVISLEPEYAGAVYFASGASTVGQLEYRYDTTNKRNHYRWTTTRTTNQDYWVSARVRLPANVSTWDPIAPIKFTYRSSGGYLNVRVLDTAGNNVSLTGANGLSNQSWTTASITGVPGSGTFSSGGYVTVLVKATASGAVSNNSRYADMGPIEFHFETKTP